MILNKNIYALTLPFIYWALIILISYSGKIFDINNASVWVSLLWWLLFLIGPPLAIFFLVKKFIKQMKSYVALLFVMLLWICGFPALFVFAQLFTINLGLGFFDYALFVFYSPWTLGLISLTVWILLFSVLELKSIK